MTTAAELLIQTARRGELHHSIILHGPARDELRALAIRVAKTLNGDDQRIERGIHPDVHLIRVEGDRKLISIEQIREVVDGATMRPYEGKSKVFIIEPADALSVSGSNSLLKTLEEPTRDTLFILLTRSPELLLPTIRSRSQSIYVGGEESRDEELASFVRDGLARFANDDEAAALLSVAAAISSHDDVNSAIALLGSILCEAAAGRIEELATLDRDRALAAADETMAALKHLIVNADARLIVEQALAKLVA